LDDDTRGTSAPFAPTAPPGASAPSGASTVNLAAYCAAHRRVGAACQPEDDALDCAQTFSQASDVYREAYVACANDASVELHFLCGYPGGPCVTRRVTERPQPTAAQSALAAGYCAACEGSAPGCTDRLFAAPYEDAETLPFAILAVSDASATSGLSCVDPTTCGSFITCLAKFRPY
jgi:hypothetical protein